VQATRWTASIASALLFIDGTHAAQDRPIKPPIRGLVSMVEANKTR